MIMQYNKYNQKSQKQRRFNPYGNKVLIYNIQKQNRQPYNRNNQRFNYNQRFNNNQLKQEKNKFLECILLYLDDYNPMSVKIYDSKQYT